MGAERREATRHRIHGGNAEFQAVMGRGRAPGERARVLDWSRGGLSLKVKSPRRRFLIAKQDPVLFDGDTVNCMLRLPPSYAEIFVSADVVHVRRDPSDQDSLFVGLRFDLENTPPEKLAVLAAMIEPRARTVSGRLSRASAASQRINERLESPSDEQPVRKTSGKSKRISRRSQRIDAQLESPLDEQPDRKTSRKSKRISRRSARVQPAE